ncbi:hypothetical protein FGO68_gene5205 [Halteria grandinella]|uniref:Uncharacterized protein n=1 Tax=Halteria grandinella TaxID=5974 RepID=A0A8J8SYC7_HALGN|nr:hypothetical protein FGO68_gene5205 [Halteria grandinella]
MDLLLADKWLSDFLDLSVLPSELEQDEAMNIFFESQGYQSKFILYNLGSTLVFLLMHLTLLMYAGLMGFLSSFSLNANKQYRFLHPRLFWGSTIRFIIQQFQPIIFASLINIRSASLSNFRNKSLGFKFSFTVSVGIFSVIMLSIFVFYRIIQSGKAAQDRFNSLIEGLKSSTNGIAAYWTVWTLMKWSLMCFMLVLLTDYPRVQLQLLTALSIFSTAFLPCL